MGMFGSKPLDYKVGDGTLPKLKPSKYFAHHLPGEPTLTQMDFDLLSEEAKSGKHELLINKAVNFGISLEYSEGDHDYSSSTSTLPKPIANSENNNQGNNTDEAMAFLANVVKQKIDNEIKLYIELLPYLEKFEEKLRTNLSLEQRKFFMCIFRIGMGLSLIENLSGLNIQGFCHPSMSNILHSPRQVLESLIKHGFSWDLNFVGTNESQMGIVKLALYIGYFQSKYTAETPSSVMEFVAPIE
jgi:hypothetical protein